MWQSRKRQGARADSTVLLYGCRTDKDNLFVDEDRDSHRRITAFSRQNGAKKTYVQDLLAKDEGKRLFRDIVMDRGGTLLVCGSVS